MHMKSNKNLQFLLLMPLPYKTVIRTIIRADQLLHYDTTNEENINQVLELNKLEAHLLKLVIPFVRIAHCQSGSYLKVKGNLILISANITHSLSKILPKEQNILPVCFKRKMEYKGNFLEEMIDKNKVDLYFKFFKNYNPLYKDILMEEERIDKFQTECQQVAERFEDAEVETVKLEPDDGDSHSDTDTETSYDNCENFEGFNIPEEEEETYFFRDQSTVFCNKYEEDISVPSVANRLANIIVDVEIANNIDSESYEPENMDVNDENFVHETQKLLNEKASRLLDLVYKQTCDNVNNLN